MIDSNSVTYALIEQSSQHSSVIFSSVYDLAFKPDGSQLIIAAGHRVLVRLVLLVWRTSKDHIHFDHI